MATSLGSNTYNRQNWEDAVSAPAGGGRREAARRASCGRAGLGLRRGRGHSGEEPALRPSKAGAGGWRAALRRLGGRGFSQGPGTSPLSLPAVSNLGQLVMYSTAACRKCRQRPLPRRGPCWTWGSCRPVSPLPALPPPPGE
jgi:hypothetical protein